MSRWLRVRWTLTPKFPPRPWRRCRGCGGQQPFVTSDKFRLNANGKRLDAWLVYRCTSCNGTWNRTILERKLVTELDPVLLAGLEANDLTLARRVSFDLASLRRMAERVDEAGDVDVSEYLLADEPAMRSALEIHLVAPFPVAARLDRLLADQLGLSRSQIVAMADAGRLMPVQALRKRVRDGTVVRIELVLGSDRRG